MKIFSKRNALIGSVTLWFAKRYVKRRFGSKTAKTAA
jgi:hypothetical protein